MLARMTKTVVVKVWNLVMHPRVKRYYKQTNKFMAHDESQSCQLNDVVRIESCRPLSKRKSYVVTQILKRDEAISYYKSRMAKLQNSLGIDRNQKGLADAL